MTRQASTIEVQIEAPMARFVRFRTAPLAEAAYWVWNSGWQHHRTRERVTVRRRQDRSRP